MICPLWGGCRKTDRCLLRFELPLLPCTNKSHCFRSTLLGLMLSIPLYLVPHPITCSRSLYPASLTSGPVFACLHPSKLLLYAVRQVSHLEHCCLLWLAAAVLLDLWHYLPSENLLVRVAGDWTWHSSCKVNALLLSCEPPIKPLKVTWVQGCSSSCQFLSGTEYCF